MVDYHFQRPMLLALFFRLGDLMTIAVFVVTNTSWSGWQINHDTYFVLVALMVAMHDFCKELVFSKRLGFHSILHASHANLDVALNSLNLFCSTVAMIRQIVLWQDHQSDSELRAKMGVLIAMTSVAFLRTTHSMGNRMLGKMDGTERRGETETSGRWSMCRSEKTTLLNSSGKKGKKKKSLENELSSNV